LLETQNYYPFFSFSPRRREALAAENEVVDCFEPLPPAIRLKYIRRHSFGACSLLFCLGLTASFRKWPQVLACGAMVCPYSLGGMGTCETLRSLMRSEDFAHFILRSLATTCGLFLPHNPIGRKR